MTKEDFIEILVEKGITFEVGTEGFKVDASLDLRSLTSLPEGVTLTAGRYIDLSSLTSLPEGVALTAGWYLDLSSLTSLPEGVALTAGWDLDLGSLTSLPEGVTLTAGGFVDLRSLTSLPEGVALTAGGNIYLGSLTSLPEEDLFVRCGCVLVPLITGAHRWRGEVREFRLIDGFSMIITSTKQVGEVSISRARYFGGGPIENFKACYIAERDGHTAHGETTELAIADLNFKILQSTADVSDVVAQIKAAGTVSLAQYRILTGACQHGCEHFLSQHNLVADSSLPIKDVIKLTQNAFGGEKFAELLQNCVCG